MLPHANLIEYVFVVVAVMGLLLAIRRFLHTIRILHSVHEYSLSFDLHAKEEELRATVETDIRREFFLGIIHGMIAVTAVAFLFLAPPPPLYSDVPQSRFGLLMWICISMLLTIKSAVVAWSRRQEETFYDLKTRPDRRKPSLPTHSNPR